MKGPNVSASVSNPTEQVEPGPSLSTGNTASRFRAKVSEMKVWKPLTVPSNRDKLELYALHKQVVSGDTPKEATSSQTAMSPAERAKLNAWKSKKGLSQSDAMAAYLVEADRQMKVYGTQSSSSSPRSLQTPMNTPADTVETHHPEDDHSHDDASSAATKTVLLTPRGLAAVPLLCAACSETRVAYIHRLDSTGLPSNGWWRRQEPLCAADPNSIYAWPENLVIYLASTVEGLSLTLSSDAHLRQVLTSMGLRPAILQSMLWPLHNVLLVIWILVLFLSTIGGSALVSMKTILLGSKRTGIRLEDVFTQDIDPCKITASSLCQSHQAITVRLLGLLLYPIGMICEWAQHSRSKALLGREAGGLVLGTFVFALGIFLSLGYWFFLLPWAAVAAMGIAVSISWCFGLIELASTL